MTVPLLLSAPRSVQNMQLNQRGDSAAINKLDVLKSFTPNGDSAAVSQKVGQQVPVNSKRKRFIQGAMEEARRAALRAGYGL